MVMVVSCDELLDYVMGEWVMIDKDIPNNNQELNQSTPPVSASSYNHKRTNVSQAFTYLNISSNILSI